MEDFENNANNGINICNKLINKFKKILNRPFDNVFLKDSENLYLYDKYDYIRIHLKICPIIGIINKKNDNEILVLSAVGKNNNDKYTKLTSEKAKYVFSRSFDYFDQLEKLMYNNESWGKEIFINDDYYRYKKYNITKTFNVNNVQEIIQKELYFVLSKMKEMYIYMYKTDEFIKFFIIYDYNLIKNNTYKIINNKISKII